MSVNKFQATVEYKGAKESFRVAGLDPASFEDSARVRAIAHFLHKHPELNRPYVPKESFRQAAARFLADGLVCNLTPE